MSAPWFILGLCALIKFTSHEQGHLLTFLLHFSFHNFLLTQEILVARQILPAYTVLWDWQRGKAPHPPWFSVFAGKGTCWPLQHYGNRGSCHVECLLCQSLVPCGPGLCSSTMMYSAQAMQEEVTMYKIQITVLTLKVLWLARTYCGVFWSNCLSFPLWESQWISNLKSDPKTLESKTCLRVRVCGASTWSCLELFLGLFFMGTKPFSSRQHL